MKRFLIDFFTIEAPINTSDYVIGKVYKRKRNIRWSSVGVLLGIVIVSFYAYLCIKLV